jgi:hypothetical protein
VPVLLLSLVAAALILPGAASAAEPVPDFTVEPAPGSSLAPAGGYFRLVAKPRDTATQALVVRNTSNRPIEIRLAAVDARTAAYGGVSYGLPAEATKGVGTWISLQTERLRLRARESAKVLFSVAVPSDAGSGEHLGGLAIWSPRDAQAQESERGAGQAGASVTIQTRRVIALVVRVPGPVAPRLVVTGVAPAPRADGLYLTVAVANRGGLLTKATGVLSLPGEGFTERFSVDSIVPGTSVAYPLKWTERPRDGEYRARVDLRYGSRTAVWEGTFTVGEQVSAELVDRGAADTADRPQSNSILLALAAAGAGAAGVLALALLAWFALRRRRRRPPGGPPTAAAHADDATDPRSPTASGGKDETLAAGGAHGQSRSSTAQRRHSDDQAPPAAASPHTPDRPEAAATSPAAAENDVTRYPAPPRAPDGAPTPRPRPADNNGDSQARTREPLLPSPSGPIDAGGSIRSNQEPTPTSPNRPRATDEHISAPAARLASLAGAAVAGATLLIIMRRGRGE